MVRRIAFSLLGAAVFYFAGALACWVLTQLLSSNTHDRDVEAAMTAAFVCGPLAAVVGFVVGLIFSRPKRLTSP